MDFADTGKARQLQANGNVQTERWVTGHPLQVATAGNGLAQMSADGGWSQMDLQGDVKLKEGDRSGQADHATLPARHADGYVDGPSCRTRLDHRDARARASPSCKPPARFLPKAACVPRISQARGQHRQLAPVPANITADSLQGNSKTGRALYTGHARLWQGDSVLEANSIELLRDSRVLHAVRECSRGVSASLEPTGRPIHAIRRTMPRPAPKQVNTSQ